MTVHVPGDAIHDFQYGISKARIIFLTMQWRIQDFPDGGGGNLLFGKKFAEHEKSPLIRQCNVNF